MARICSRKVVACLIPLIVPSFATQAGASSGTEGASFLDIPVGAAPAALGSAYTARATDAYAPVWNPAGLGFATGIGVSATHLSYLQGINYEFLGLALPLGGSNEAQGFSLSHPRGLGASVQYLGSGNIVAANEAGTITGSFSSSFAAYSLAYGQALTDQWSLGLTGKAITESIADASASAYAGDVGTLYKVNDQWSLAGVVANVGSSVKLVDQSDPLPLNARVGAYDHLDPDWDASAEIVDRQAEGLSVCGGLQWTYKNALVLRTGLNSSHTSGLSTLSAFTAGIGIRLWGQEFAYAWVPYSDLGNTNYFSLNLRFGGSSETQNRGLIQMDKESSSSLNNDRNQGGYEDLEGLLSPAERKALSEPNGAPSPKDNP